MVFLFKRKVSKKVIVLFSISVLLIIAGLLFYDPIKHTADHLFDSRLKGQDKAKISKEMAADWPIVQQNAALLGIMVSKPTDATCQPGDPTLYAFDCIVSAGVTFDNTNRLSDPNDAAQKLKAFDEQLKANGWQIDSGDFRSQSGQPYSKWASTLYYTGANIAYKKGTCYFESHILLSPDQAKYYAQTPGQLSCAIDDGNPTEYY